MEQFTSSKIHSKLHHREWRSTFREVSVLRGVGRGLFKPSYYICKGLLYLKWNIRPHWHCSSKIDVRLTVVTLGCRKNSKTVLAHECLKTKLKKQTAKYFYKIKIPAAFIVLLGWDGMGSEQCIGWCQSSQQSTRLKIICYVLCYISDY